MIRTKSWLNSFSSFNRPSNARNSSVEWTFVNLNFSKNVFVVILFNFTFILRSKDRRSSCISSSKLMTLDVNFFTAP